MNRLFLILALALFASLGAGCDAATCPTPPALPVEMSLARAAELAPGVERGLALSTSIRARPCEAMLPGACPDIDCGIRRADLAVWILPLGLSLPVHEGICPRKQVDLDGRALAKVTASEAGEVVVPIDAPDVLVFLGDTQDSAGCAACGRVGEGSGCAIAVPGRGLVVRDLILDSMP